MDCLEFDAALRAGDPFDEIAFLDLECERLGSRWAGRYIRRRIAAALRDGPADELFAFYRCYRATLRARGSPGASARTFATDAGKVAGIGARFLQIALADAVRSKDFSKHKQVGEPATVMKARDGFREQRRGRQNIELIPVNVRVEPEYRNRIGNHDTIDRRIGEQLGRTGHERPCVTIAITCRAPLRRAERAVRNNVVPVLIRSSTTSAVAPSTSPTKRSPETIPALRCFSANPNPTGCPVMPCSCSRNSSARLAPPVSG